MITASVFRNNKGDIYGFEVNDHSDELICAAVTTLVLNTVNSIEALTDAAFTCDYEEEGGFISFELPDVKDGNSNSDAALLINSMLLGLNFIKSEYEGQLTIIDKILEG